MIKILIAGRRPEISRLFELLLWQPDRKFLSTGTLEQCLDMSLRTQPDLIVIDGGREPLSIIHQTLVSLKGSSKTAETPVLTILKTTPGDRDTGRIERLADGLIPEPPGPATAKGLVEFHLSEMTARQTSTPTQKA